MKKIIIMNGCGGSGKDTFVKYYKEVSPMTIYKFSIIDWVKEKAKLLGWTGGKSDKDRKFLSDLNDALATWDDLPYKMAIKEIRNYLDTTDIIFIDIRDPDVIDRFKKDIYKYFEIKAITILVDRGIQKSYGNHADDQVFNYAYDYVIDNTTSLEELKAAAETFMKEIEND